MSLGKLKELCWNLWSSNPTNRSAALNKAASLAFLLCWLGGARMIDLMRLRYEDISIEENPNGSFVIARIRRSKGNVGKRCEQLTFLNLDDPELNIIKRFQSWYLFQGKPKTGLVFFNKSKNIPFTRAQMVRAGKLASQRLHWPASDAPQAHTGRNSITLILLKLGVTPQLLRVFLRWAPNSTMPSHYQGTSLETTNRGIPYQIGTAVNSGRILEIERDL